MSDSDPLISFLDQESRALGFDSMGIVACDESNDEDPQFSQNEIALRQFVEAGYHGSMNWMTETLERRVRPKTLWPDVQSIIMLSMNYGPETNPLEILNRPDKGAISVYARHRDYHDVMKGRLKTLASKLVARARSQALECDVKVFVDTAPVMEKPLAHRAGLGWQGKHTNLVSRQYGSWLFLGSIFTTLDLAPGRPEADHCGSCQDCLDICPTDAFPAPYKLDARRCISYLTIENRGPIPVEFRKAMGNRIYGCDDCLAVCPWNKFAKNAAESKLSQPENASPPLLEDFLGLDDAAFRAWFSGSPVKRIGRNRFMRNCLIAAGNSKTPSLVASVKALQTDPDPVVAEAAQWAIGELMKVAQ